MRFPRCSRRAAAVIDIRMLYRTNIDELIGQGHAPGAGLDHREAGTHATIRAKMAKTGTVTDAERISSEPSSWFRIGPSINFRILDERTFTTGCKAIAGLPRCRRGTSMEDGNRTRAALTVLD